MLYHRSLDRILFMKIDRRKRRLTRVLVVGFFLRERKKENSSDYLSSVPNSRLTIWNDLISYRQKNQDTYKILINRFDPFFFCLRLVTILDSYSFILVHILSQLFSNKTHLQYQILFGLDQCQDQVKDIEYDLI